MVGQIVCTWRLLRLGDGTPVGYVNTVQEFTDILVPYAADALDGGSCGKSIREGQRLNLSIRTGLGDVVDIVALEDKLVLLGF